MKTIDLNCDMGELKEGQTRNYDAEIMPYISSCNIACGFHSGSPLLIEQTIQAALLHGVAIGAHPSYNDRKNFGRLSVDVDTKVLLADLRYQISALKGMVESYGQHLQHVKPHGALYNDLLVDTPLANQFIALVKSIDPALRIVTLAHSKVVDLCQEQGVEVVQEGFADRRYEQKTQLRSRSYPNAVLQEPAEVLKQVQGFLQQQVYLANGQQENIQVDTICLHSDTQGAVQLSKTIHHYLQENEIKITATR